MRTEPAIAVTAADLRDHLELLEIERASASLWGLDSDPSYMQDLRDEVAATRAAFVGAAVTEIASLRGALGGRLRG